MLNITCPMRPTLNFVPEFGHFMFDHSERQHTTQAKITSVCQHSTLILRKTASPSQMKDLIFRVLLCYLEKIPNYIYKNVYGTPTFELSSIISYNIPASLPPTHPPKTHREPVPGYMQLNINIIKISHRYRFITILHTLQVSNQ